MSTPASLDAAAQARKSRLSQLKSLKRKQEVEASTTASAAKLSPDATQHFSGRNYDVETRAPRMGFLAPPSFGQETVEETAARIAEDTKAMAEKEVANDKPIDLFNLLPKKANWDLKRDAAKKLERLNHKTEIAIAKLVRQRMDEENVKDNASETLEKGLARMVEERETEIEADELEDELDDAADNPVNDPEMEDGEQSGNK